MDLYMKLETLRRRVAGVAGVSVTVCDLSVDFSVSLCSIRFSRAKFSEGSLFVILVLLVVLLPATVGCSVRESRSRGKILLRLTIRGGSLFLDVFLWIRSELGTVAALVDEFWRREDNLVLFCRLGETVVTFTVDKRVSVGLR